MTPYPPPAALATPGIVTIGPQTFAGAKTFAAAPIVSTLTANAPLVASGTKQITSQALTNGQLLIGSTSAAPVAAGLTGTSNQITVTTGAGSITLSLPQSINTNSSVTFSSLTLGSALNFIGASGNVTLNMQPSDAYTVAQYHDWTMQAIYDNLGTRTTVAGIRFQRTSTSNGGYSGIVSFFARLSGSSLFEGLRLNENGCLLVPGTITPAATGTRALWLGNGTAPTSSPADMVGIFSVDASAGNATLGLRTEAAVVTESVTSDRTLQVIINGTTYKFCLKA